MSSAIILNSEFAPPLPIRKFTVAEYHQLGELGVLTPDDRVELLEDRAKGAIYFLAGIEEYWIVNLEEKCLECYLNTSPYVPQIFERHDTIRTKIGDKTIEISLNDLF